GYFAKQHYRAVAILVANEIGATVPITLFTAENVKRRVCETKPPRFLFREIDIILSQLFWDCPLVLPELCADVLKAGQRFDTAQTIMLRDRLLQIGRDKSFDNHSARCVLLIEHTFVEQCLDSIPGMDRTRLISRQ